MTTTRAKTRAAASPVRSRNFEEDLTAATLSEPNLWTVSVALVVGENYLSSFFINELKKIVDKCVRKNFTFINSEDLLEHGQAGIKSIFVEQIMGSTKSSSGDKINKNEPKKGKDHGKPNEKGRNRTHSSSPKVGLEATSKELLDACAKYFEPDGEAVDLETSLPLPLLSLLIKDQLMNIKNRDLAGRDPDLVKRASEEKLKISKSNKQAGVSGKKGKSQGGANKSRSGKEGQEGGAKSEEEGGANKSGIDEKKENYVIEDEPKDGPNRYVLISGLSHPHIVSHLCNAGINVDAIFRVKLGERATNYSLEKKITSTDEGELSEHEESLNKKLDAKLSTFWRDVFLLLRKHPTGSPQQDVLNFDLFVDDILLDGDEEKDVADSKLKPDVVSEDVKKPSDRINQIECDGDGGAKEKVSSRKLEHLQLGMFNYIASCLYSLVVERRHLKVYKESLRVLSIPSCLPDKATFLEKNLESEIHQSTAGEGDQAKELKYLDMSFYNNMLNTLVPGQISVSLIVYCMREQVCQWEVELEEIAGGVKLIETGNWPSLRESKESGSNVSPRSNKNEITIADTDIQETGQSLQSVMEHMSKAVFQLALSDEQKEELRKIFNHPTELPPRKSARDLPECPVPQMVGYHDEVSKRLVVAQKRKEAEKGAGCFPMEFDPLKAELEMLTFTRSAELLRFAGLCACDPDLVNSRSSRELRLEELFRHCSNNSLSCMNKTELNHYLTLLVIECLSLIKPDHNGHVSRAQACPTQPPCTIVWDDPYLYDPACSSINTATNTCPSEADLLYQSLMDRLNCIRKRGLEEYCYAEAMDAQSLLQRMQTVLTTHPYVDTYVRKSDASLLVLMHNPFEESSRSRNSCWRSQVLSDCGLRNFMQFFKEHLGGWLEGEEMKYQTHKLELEAARLFEEAEAAAKENERCRLPDVANDFYIRSGSIKAQVLEEEEKLKKQKEEEEARIARSKEADKPGSRKKSNDKKDRKSTVSRSPSREKVQKKSDMKSTKSRVSMKSSATISQAKSPEGQGVIEAEPESPSMPKVYCFLGYDVGDDVINAVGTSRTMLTNDGGVIKTERLLLGQDRVLTKSCLKKDGHFFTVHVINPSFTGGEVNGGGDSNAQCEDHQPQIDCDDDNDEDVEETDEKEAGVILPSENFNCNRNVTDKNPQDNKSTIANKNQSAAKSMSTAVNKNQKDAKSVERSESPSPVVVVPTETEIKGISAAEVDSPQFPAVGEFASFVGCFSCGIFVSFSIFGSTGRPQNGKPYEPEGYVAVVPKIESDSDSKTLKPSKNRKGMSRANMKKSLTPIEVIKDSASPKVPPDAGLSENEEEVEAGDQSRREKLKQPKEKTKQDFLQFYACREDGLQVTFLLESSLGIEAKDNYDRSLVTKLTRKVPASVGGDSRGDSCEFSFNLFDERARYVTCDGNVIVVKNDGSIKVLFADGTVKELCEVPNENLAKTEPSPPSKEADAVSVVSEAATNDKTSRKQKKMETSKPAEPVQQNSEANKGAKDAVTTGFPSLTTKVVPATTLCWVTTSPKGERYIQDMEGRLTALDPVGVYQISDPHTKELLTTREDNVLSVLKPDGTLVVEHADCTRISTIQTIALDSRCEEFDKMVRTCYTIECPTYPTVCSNSNKVTVAFEKEECIIECHPEGAYNVLPPNGGVLSVNECGTAVYLGAELEKNACINPHGTLNSSASNNNAVKNYSNNSAESFDYKFKRYSDFVADKNGGLNLDSALEVDSGVSNLFQKFLKCLKDKENDSSGVYFINHGHDVVVETLDSTRRRYVARINGEAEVCFEAEPDPAERVPVTNLKGEDLKIFRLLGSDRGMELLKADLTENDLQKTENDPEVCILKEKLFDGCPETKAFGITMTKPLQDHDKTLQNKIKAKKQGKCPNKSSIVPEGLKSRSFENFPPVEEKKWGKPFGRDAGIGLNIKTWNRNCHQSSNNKDDRSTTKNAASSSDENRPSKKDSDGLQFVETRKLYQFPPMDSELKERLTASLKNYMSAVAERQREAEEVRVHDPRTDEEKEMAEELRKKMAVKIEDQDLIECPAVISNMDIEDKIEQDHDDDEDSSHEERDPLFPIQNNYCISNANAEEEAYAEQNNFAAVHNFNADRGFNTNITVTNYLTDKELDVEGYDNINLSNRADDAGDDSAMNELSLENLCNIVNEKCNDVENFCNEVDNAFKTEIVTNIHSGYENKFISNSSEAVVVETSVNPMERSKTEYPNSKSFNPRVGTIEMLTEQVSFGVVKDGEVYSYTLQLKNSGLEPKKFRIRLPPPATGLRISYQPVPIPAGLRCSIDIELYAAVSTSPSLPVVTNIVSSETRNIRHDLEICTEEGRLTCPILAIVTGSGEMEGLTDAGKPTKSLGVKKIKPKLPAGNELFRAWRTLKQQSSS